MSDYIVKDTELTSVANAIRTKGGTNSQLVFPGGFVSAIGNISGGGGSSDFSTAEVTVINNIDNNVTFYMPVIYDTTPMPSIDKAIYCAYSLADGAPSETVRVALYGGTCLAQPASDIMGETFTATGNAEYSNGMIIITGDCSITIS